MSARYQEFAPPAALAAHVQCLWVFEGQDADEPQRIVPDGCCELIAHYGAPYLELTEGAWIAQPPALFAGQLTRPLHLLAREPAGVVGVRFRTAGARAYVKRALDGFTDRRAALAEIKPGAGALSERLRAAADEEARLVVMADHLAAEIAGEPCETTVEAAVEALRASAGRLTLNGLAGEVGLSPRALQRRFLEVVGVPPRTLAAVLRFRRVFEVLQAADVDSWSAAAQAAGYFDHPQMGREFRRFLGCTPSQFVRARAGLASRLALA